MLPRSQRISSEQFDFIMEKGRVFHSSLFLMRAVSGMEDTRVAAVVPQKVSKGAITRNRVRRKTYEAVRTIRPSIKSGTHAIIFAKSAAIDSRHADMVSDIENLFVKAGFLR